MSIAPPFSQVWFRTGKNRKIDLTNALGIKYGGEEDRNLSIKNGGL